ncbi:MAG: hypothetical protein NVSMB12_16190 [Acidimicrobiales bacterium]
MSLQGSLDTFALPDVLLLLSGTAKTGCLQVTGSRITDAEERTTRVWFDEGRLAGHDEPGSPEITDAVVTLLRMRRGSFTFTPGPVPPSSETHEAEPLLAAAQARLAEWAEIESIVPSPTAWLQLADRAPRDQITVTAAQWRLLVAVGVGRSVHDVIADLAMGELPGFRAVKEMVADGLLTVDTGAGATGATGVEDASAAGAVPGPDPERLEWATPVSSWGESTLSTPSSAAWPAPPAEEIYGALRVVPDLGEATTPDATAADATSPGSSTAALPAWRAEMADIHDLDALVARPAVAAPIPAPEVGDEPHAADDVAATPDPGGDGDAGDQGDEPLNRGLLLKFLSSVRN